MMWEFWERRIIEMRLGKLEKGDDGVNAVIPGGPEMYQMGLGTTCLG